MAERYRVRLKVSDTKEIEVEGDTVFIQKQLEDALNIFGIMPPSPPSRIK